MTVNALTRLLAGIKQAAAATYEFEMVWAILAGSSKEQRRRLRQIVGNAEKIARLVANLPSEFRTAIDFLLDPRRHYLGGAVGSFNRLAEGLREIDKQYEPPKGAPFNFALHNALHEAMPRIEAYCGEESAIRWNRNVDRMAEPANRPTAFLVAMMLRIDPDLQQVAILDMIHRLKTETDAQRHARRHPLDAVMRVTCDEIELSLHPRRHEEVEKWERKKSL